MLLCSRANQSNCSDGYNPFAGVIFDSAGNLYDTTRNGGGVSSGGYGTVFRLLPTTTPPWNESLLRSFSGGDGGFPVAGLIFGGGTLYGTTSAFGAYNGGTVFKLTPKTTPPWNET